MKATQKNLPRKDLANKLGHASLERIKGFLRIGSTLNQQSEGFKTSITGYSQSKENDALRIELEIKRNQALTYASILPPK